MESDDFNRLYQNIEKMADRIGRINDIIVETKARVDSIIESLSRFVTKEEFFPVKLIAYGIISLTITTLIGGFIGFLIQK